MSSTFVIAEAGVNHNGSAEAALALIDVAADAGADAVKFQTFKAERLADPSARKCDYQLASDGAANQFDMLKRLELPTEAHAALKTHCDARGIAFLSTAFDVISLGMLVELGVARIKIPSGELTNPLLLLAAARTGKPIILSTGMAELGEIETALAIVAFGLLNRHGFPDDSAVREAYADPQARALLTARCTLLQCTTSYPAALDDINLRAMDTLRETFHLPVGLSDHSTGIVAAMAAVARGASVIEKHFTLSRDLPGPDHAASLEPQELKHMIAAIRDVERALGSPEKRPSAVERENLPRVRPVILAAEAVARGTPLTLENLALRRAAFGRPATDLLRLLGRPAGRDYRAGEAIDAIE